MAGAPIGNTNSADGKRYRKALERALAHAGGSVDEGLFKLAQVRVGKALDGDAEAARSIEDRIDGKPVQALAGAEGEPALELVLRWASEKS